MKNKKIGERIIRHFKLTKFALYKFLGNFIPYFKNKLYMILDKIDKNIEDILTIYINNNNKFVVFDKNIVFKDIDANQNQKLDATTYVIDYILKSLAYEEFFKIRVNYYIKTNSIEFNLLIEDSIHKNGKFLSEIASFFEDLITEQEDVFKCFTINKN